MIFMICWLQQANSLSVIHWYNPKNKTWVQHILFHCFPKEIFNRLFKFQKHTAHIIQIKTKQSPQDTNITVLVPAVIKRWLHYSTPPPFIQNASVYCFCLTGLLYWQLCLLISVPLCCFADDECWLWMSQNVWKMHFCCSNILILTLIHVAYQDREDSCS